MDSIESFYDNLSVLRLTHYKRLRLFGWGQYKVSNNIAGKQDSVRQSKSCIWILLTAFFFQLIQAMLGFSMQISLSVFTSCGGSDFVVSSSNIFLMTIFRETCTDVFET